MTKNEIEKVEPNPVDRVINAIKKIEKCGYFIVASPSPYSLTGYEYWISLSDRHHQLDIHQVEGHADNVDALARCLESLANEYDNQGGWLRRWMRKWRKEK